MHLRAPRRGAAAALLAAPLVLLQAACGKGQAGTPEPGAAGPVLVLGAENVATVESRTLQSGPALAGALRARREATLRAEVSGTLLENAAEPGLRVKKGQVLARIEDGGLSNQLVAAQQAVAAAEHASKLARREMDRARKMAEAGAVAERDVDRVETQLAAQEAMEADAKARLAGAELLFGRTRVRAPFDGVISDRQARAGDVVLPGLPLFTAVDPGSMRLEASVAADGLERIRPGTKVTFTVSGYGARVFTGQIEQVNPVVDAATGQVRITVAIPNGGGELLAGLFAKGRVAAESRTVAALPQDAIDSTTTPPSVLRIKDGKVERAPVTLGMHDETAERVEVKGLAPGELVLRGAVRTGVAEGTPVRTSLKTAGR